MHLITKKSRRIFYAKRKKAFTLAELLLVIGIMGVLTTIVIVAVNPVKQLQSAQDASRNFATNQLQKAFNQYLIEKGSYPNSSLIPTSASSAMPVCKQGITTDATCINADGLVSTYIASLPQDPSETNANYTGYKIYTLNGRIQVTTPYLGGGTSSTSSSSATTISDTFTDTNGTAVTSHTLDSGGSWTGYALSGNAPTIQSNQVTESLGPGAENFYTTNCASDGTMTASIKLYTDAVAGIIFRLSDTNNLWDIWPNTNTGKLELYQVQSGVSSQVANTSFSWSSGGTYTLTVTLSGNSISATINGATVNYTSTFNQTSNNCGFRIYKGGSAGGSVTFDTFSAPHS